MWGYNMTRFLEPFKNTKTNVPLLKFKYEPTPNSDCCAIYSYSKDARNPVCYYGAKKRHTSQNVHIGTRRLGFCALYVFYEGNFGFVFDDVSYRPSTGDIFIVKNNVEFTVFFPQNTYVYYYEINFPMDFFESVCDESMFHRLFFENNDDGFIALSLNANVKKLIFEKFDNLDQIIIDDKFEKDFLSWSYIIQIIELISSSKNNKIEISQVGKVPIKLIDALNYIHSNFTNPITISDVSEYCGISNTYLARMFKKFYLCRPLEYVTKLRIAHSKTLLAKGVSVLDACYSSGFNDCKYFTTKFKSATGTTPYKYKKKNS